MFAKPLSRRIRAIGVALRSLLAGRSSADQDSARNCAPPHMDRPAALRDVRFARSLVALVALWIVRLLGQLLPRRGPSRILAQAAKVRLPEDEGPHNVRKEWWYFTGHLKGKDANGFERSYGYELTFFRRDILFPKLSSYRAHFALTDLDRKTFQFDTRIAFHGDVLMSGYGYDIGIRDWQMTGRNGIHQLRVASHTAGYGLDLDLTSLAAAALHGNDGIIPYGAMGSSYYYSQSNLRTTGIITDHDEKIEVVGKSWFDHQWGNFTITLAGWDWFSVQLDDGTAYMVYRFRDGLNAVIDSIGSAITSDGKAIPIDPKVLTVTRLGTWKSPATGHVYDSGWTVTVPSGTLTINPKQPNQELYSALGKYWEGACDVTGNIDGKTVRGVGYTEILPPCPQI